MMGNYVSKPKMSMVAVTMIFLVLYLVILVSGGIFFYKFVYPKIADKQVSKVITNFSNQVNDLIQKGESSEALTMAQEMFSQAKTGSEKALSYQSLGFVYIAQKDCQSAEIYFSQAISLNENLPEVYLGRGSCDLLNKNYLNALEESQKALTVLNTLQNQIGTSIPDNPILVSLNKDKGAAYFIAAGADIGLNNKTQAVQDVEKALKFDLSNIEYKNVLTQLQNTPTPVVSVKANQNTSVVNGLGYTLQNLADLKAEIQQLNDVAFVTKAMSQTPQYNQKVVQEAIQNLNQELAITQELMDKMNKNLPLNQMDFTSSQRLRPLSNQLSDLMKQLENGKYGY